MYWREVCFLCGQEHEELDKLGKPYQTFEKRALFCNEKGVKRSEFYQAEAQGYRPELCLEIRAEEYGGETHVEFRRRMYRIIRTYPVKRECLEIICQALVTED